MMMAARPMVIVWIINPWGEVLADAGTMEEGFVIAKIDITEVAAARQKIRNLQHEQIIAR